MVDSTRHVTVRLTPSLRANVEREAANKSCSPSEIIRRSIEHLLDQRLIGES